MRNCFTKITNVFRKKKIQNSSEHGHLTEAEYLRQRQQCEGEADDDDVYTRKETTTTDTMASCTIGAATVCTSAADNQTSQSNDEGNDSNVIEHKKISASSYNHDSDHAAQGISATRDKHQNSIKIPSRTTPSLGSHNCDNQRSFRSVKNYTNNFTRPSDLKTKSSEKQVACALFSKENTESVLVRANAKSNVGHNGGLSGTYNRPTYEKWEHKLQMPPLTKRQTDPLCATANMNRSCTERHSRLSLPMPQGLVGKHGNEGVAEARTPEDMEYDANVAAESLDVMTPLPNNARSNPLAVGRSAQSEIVDVIRTLDTNSMRINNLTIEDKADLLCHFENKHQQLKQSTSHTNFVQSGLFGGTRQKLLDELSDSDTDGVILRRKWSHPVEAEIPASGLYERRQPKSPKLKLILESRKAEAITITSSKNVRHSDIEVCTCISEERRRKLLCEIIRSFYPYDFPRYSDVRNCNIKRS